MSTQAHKFCIECGAALRAKVKFCESCGTPVDAGASPDPSAAPAPASTEERLVGQMPCEWIRDKKGLFGGLKTRQGNLLITDRRIAFLHDVGDSISEEIGEDEWVESQATQRGLSWREVVRDYDWFSGAGRRFVGVAVDTLIAENGENWQTPLSRLVCAKVFLGSEDETDQMTIEVERAAPLRFFPFRASGETAAGWMRELLGADRSEITNQKLIRS